MYSIWFCFAYKGPAVVPPVPECARVHAARDRSRVGTALAAPAPASRHTSRSRQLPRASLELRPSWTWSAPSAAAVVGPFKVLSATSTTPPNIGQRNDVMARPSLGRLTSIHTAQILCSLKVRQISLLVALNKVEVRWAHAYCFIICCIVEKKTGLRFFWINIPSSNLVFRCSSSYVVL